MLRQSVLLCSFLVVALNLQEEERPSKQDNEGQFCKSPNDHRAHERKEKGERGRHPQRTDSTPAPRPITNRGRREALTAARTILESFLQESSMAPVVGQHKKTRRSHGRRTDEPVLDAKNCARLRQAVRRAFDVLSELGT